MEEFEKILWWMKDHSAADLYFLRDDLGRGNEVSMHLSARGSDRFYTVSEVVESNSRATSNLPDVLSRLWKRLQEKMAVAGHE